MRLRRCSSAGWLGQVMAEDAKVTCPVEYCTSGSRFVVKFLPPSPVVFSAMHASSSYSTIVSCLSLSYAKCTLEAFGFQKKVGQERVIFVF